MQSKALHLVLLVLIAFFLNFVWETLHGLLYLDHPSMIALRYVPMVLYAASVDALLIGGLASLAFWLSAFVYKKRYCSRVFWTLFLSCALLIAYGIEYHALSTGKWTYTSAMPLVFDVGLSPLVQLMLTGSISIWIILKLERRFS